MSDAQKRAAAPGTSAWVAAAAGTGKTRVLRDRVLRLMLAGTAPQRILCLTYTKAAAAEMANRINDALADWVVMEDDALAADLAGLGVSAPSPETLAAARRLFADVLDTPGGMKIQTIHAFCQSVLARFPLEAEMAPHFTLMEDNTGQELERDALDAILAEAAATPQPALQEAIDHLAWRCSDHALTELVSRLFAERARLQRLWTQSDRPGSAALEAALAIGLGFDAPPDPEAILAEACGEGAFDGAGLLHAARTLLDGGKTDQERGRLIADWLAMEDAARPAGFESYCRAFLKKDGGLFAKLATKAIAEAAPEAVTVLGLEAERLKGVCDALNLAEVWAASTALHRLGRRVVERYDLIKLRQALMDYTDLILRTLALFATPGIAPWVLYKLDGGIDHILVDEAQDTSPEQWRIIDVLVTEFFTGESAAGGDRTVFAVGDVQQSIYGFQGAAPREFYNYRDRFKTLAEQAGKDFAMERLTLTYRTAQPVLDVVNRIFDQDSRTVREGAPGIVELWPVDSGLKGEDEWEPWTPPLTQFQVDDPAARCARRIAERIEGWLRSGERLSAEKAVSPGDIMILVRRRNEFVGHMIRELGRRNIPVAGADRMVLMDELVVMDLVALAAFALLPEDDLTLACILKGPLCGLDEEQLFSLAHPREGTLWDELRRRRAEDAAYTAAHALLADILSIADRMPPFEFFSHILNAHDGRRRLVTRLGTQAIDPMEEFLTLALQFEQTHTPSLQEFLHWMESGSFVVKRETDTQRDEVRVMTVHGAKGLEAPIVFLPDTCGQPQSRNDLLWLEDDMMIWPPRKELLAGPALAAADARKAAEMEEYNRLLYVAMTRARDRLYVAGFEKRKKTGTCWYETVRGAMEGMADQVTRLPQEDGTEIWRYGSAGDFTVTEYTPLLRERLPDLPRWLDRPPPAEPTPPRPLTPSRPEEEDPPVMSPARLGAGREARFSRGRVMHRLLELLPELPANERQAAGAQFLAQQRPALAPKTQAEYLAEVLAIIAHPDYAVFFGPHSAAEIPIVGVAEGRPVAGQVDRLAVTADAVHIIDYKTNRPAPMSLDAVPAAYRRQMAAYRAILSKLYPEKKIVCALLWTEGPRLLRLDQD